MILYGNKVQLLIYIYNSRKLLLNYSKLFFYIFVFRATLGGSHLKNGEYSRGAHPTEADPSRSAARGSAGRQLPRGPRAQSFPGFRRRRERS